MSTLREAAEEALRWMEHARLHLTIKERMHPDGLSLYDSAAEALRAALAQPETDAGVSWDGHNVRGDADSIAEVRRLIDFEQARQGAKPPTESPIAAKCQRIEGSGEICGLTPPCPDCGSSLIDVAEGSL